MMIKADVINDKYTLKEMLLAMTEGSRAELSKKFWLTAARTHTYPFMLSNVMKQRNAQLKLLKVLIRNNRLRRWALGEPLRWLLRRGAT